LYPLFGIRLSPMLAAVAMALSSLSVVTNANRLRRYHPAPLPQPRLEDASNARGPAGVAEKPPSVRNQ
jgi:Cu+-exporting ATPase